MKETEWLLLDTEAIGFSQPVFVVETGAQKMRGWEPERAAFRKLLNQNCEIPPEAAETVNQSLWISAKRTVQDRTRSWQEMACISA